MVHDVLLTPLACALHDEAQEVLLWDRETYEAAAKPVVYCPDPDLSRFYLRSTGESPYIEAVFYGVQGGDRVTVKFEALVRAGSSSLAVDVFELTPRYERVLSVTNELPPDALNTYFRDYAIPCLLQVAPDSLGVALRIRPTRPESEVVVRHMRVEIESANQSFHPELQVVRYESVGDFLDCIRTYCLTDADPAYNDLAAALRDGLVNFPDECTVSFKDAAGFRGLMAMLAGSRYRVPVTIYFEHTGAAVTTGVRGLNHANEVLCEKRNPLPSTGAWRRQAVQFSGSGLEGARKLLADVRALDGPVQLRNVRFVAARFDDEPKRSPNRLEDLFSDLGTRLRGAFELI